MGNLFSKTTTTPPYCPLKSVSSLDKSVWGYKSVNATELDILDTSDTSDMSSSKLSTTNVFMSVRTSSLPKFQNLWNYLIYFTNPEDARKRHVFLLVRSDCDSLKTIKTTFHQGVFTILFFNKKDDQLFNVQWSSDEYSMTHDNVLLSVKTKLVFFNDGAYSVLVPKETGGSARVSSTDLQPSSGGSARVISTNLQPSSGGSARVSSTDLGRTGGIHYPNEITTFIGMKYTITLGKDHKGQDQVTFTRANSLNEEDQYQASFGLYLITGIKMYQMEKAVLILIHRNDQNVYLSGFSTKRKSPTFTTIQVTNITPNQQWLVESRQTPTRIFQRIEFLENNQFKIFFKNGCEVLYQINQNGEISKPGLQ